LETAAAETATNNRSISIALMQYYLYVFIKTVSCMYVL